MTLKQLQVANHLASQFPEASEIDIDPSGIGETFLWIYVPAAQGGFITLTYYINPDGSYRANQDKTLIPCPI